jgi:hypothetical protein
LMDQDAIRAMQDGWAFVFRQGALLAQMPIEEWLAAFARAESIAPIIDPTLFIKYYSKDSKGDIIRGVLKGALTFKRAILKAQATVIAKGMGPDV